jgi:hypothetical protein
MTTENNQPTAPESTVYWRPDEQVILKGTELAALLHLVDLQTVAINQVPLNTLMELFSTANAAKTDIMQRLAEEGKLHNTPVGPLAEEAKVVEFETEEPTIEDSGEISIEDLKNIEDTTEDTGISDEIL